MKTLVEMKAAQKEYIRSCIERLNGLLALVDKSQLAAVLLSGSVSRGDFCPGSMGGMIDLTVIAKKDSKLSAEDIFGKDEDPFIPYHCIQRDGQWFSIAFHPYMDENDFSEFDEAKKFAFLESRLVWQYPGGYEKELEAIGNCAKTEQLKMKNDCIGYINYLLSDYKIDRWRRRDAYPQLHENLSTAVREAVKCLYYVNGKYAAAEDRRLYYSYALSALPLNYETLVAKLIRADIDSAADYRRRAALFEAELRPFVAK